MLVHRGMRCAEGKVGCFGLLVFVAHGWVEQGWHSLPPERKPLLSGPSPERVQGPDSHRRVTPAEDGSHQYVARVMRAVVDAGEADQHRRGQHEPGAAAIVDEQNHGGREPVRGVRGGHADAVAFCVGSRRGRFFLGRRGRRQARKIGTLARAMDAGKGILGPLASHEVLEVVADQAVAERDDQGQHEDAHRATRAAFPNEQNSRQKQQRGEDGVAARQGHHHVEDGIDQREVDESEQLSVQRLQPMHSGSLRSIHDERTHRVVLQFLSGHPGNRVR
jgi:hypothetical protein